MMVKGLRGFRYVFEDEPLDRRECAAFASKKQAKEWYAKHGESILRDYETIFLKQTKLILLCQSSQQTTGQVLTANQSKQGHTLHGVTQ